MLPKSVFRFIPFSAKSAHQHFTWYTTLYYGHYTHICPIMPYAGHIASPGPRDMEKEDQSCAQIKTAHDKSV